MEKQVKRKFKPTDEDWYPKLTSKFWEKDAIPKRGKGEFAKGKSGEKKSDSITEQGI